MRKTDVLKLGAASIFSVAVFLFFLFVLGMSIEPATFFSMSISVFAGLFVGFVATKRLKQKLLKTERKEL